MYGGLRADVHRDGDSPTRGVGLTRGASLPRGLDRHDGPAIAAVTEVLAENRQPSFAPGPERIGEELIAAQWPEPFDFSWMRIIQKPGNRPVDVPDIPLIVPEERFKDDTHRARCDTHLASESLPRCRSCTARGDIHERWCIETGGDAIADVGADEGRPTGHASEQFLPVGGEGQRVSAYMTFPQHHDRVGRGLQANQSTGGHRFRAVHLPESGRFGAILRRASKPISPDAVTRGLEQIRRARLVGEAEDEVEIEGRAALESHIRRRRKSATRRHLAGPDHRYRPENLGQAFCGGWGSAGDH